MYLSLSLSVSFPLNRVFPLLHTRIVPDQITLIMLGTDIHIQGWKKSGGGKECLKKVPERWASEGKKK